MRQGEEGSLAAGKVRMCIPPWGLGEGHSPAGPWRGLPTYRCKVMSFYAFIICSSSRKWMPLCIVLSQANTVQNTNVTAADKVVNLFSNDVATLVILFLNQMRTLGQISPLSGTLKHLSSSVLYVNHTLNLRNRWFPNQLCYLQNMHFTKIWHVCISKRAQKLVFFVFFCFCFLKGEQFYDAI